MLSAVPNAADRRKRQPHINRGPGAGAADAGLGQGRHLHHSRRRNRQRQSDRVAERVRESRRVILGASMLGRRGRVQHASGVTHLIVEQATDLSGELRRVSGIAGAFSVHAGRGDDAKRCLYATAKRC